MKTLTFFNKNFRFVYQPKENKLLNIPSLAFDTERRDERFLVGAGKIGYYITPKNAETVLKCAEKMKTDKYTCKFRKYGKIDIYVK